MPECSYCDASFEDEDALVAHMGDAHEGELGRVDQRRVDEAGAGGEDGGFPTGPVVLVGVIGFAVALVAFVIVGMGGDGGAGGELGPLQSDHAHGTMEMTVLGERVDFSQSRYQVQADRFHFEEGNGRVWHTHATGVNLSWAMGTLDIGLTENSVTYEGTTYRDTDPQYNVSITVDGEPVDPASYVLQGVSVQQAQQGGGDSVRIAVSEANSTS